MLNLRKVISLVIIVVLFIPCTNIAAEEINTYTITYTGLRANYNTYLPNSLYPVGSYSNLNNSLEGLIIKPYSVQVSYSINRSSTPSNHSMTITPYLRIRKCTINGAIEEYFVDTTNSCSGVFELPAYCGINISVYTGANKNKWNGDNDGYNWTLTLNYQYDQTPPSPPGTPEVLYNGGEVLKIDNLHYITNLNSASIQWAAATDNGTGISEYLLKVNDLPDISIPGDQTSYNLTGLADGDNTIKIRALDKDPANAPSDYSQEIIVKVDPSMPDYGGSPEAPDISPLSPEIYSSSVTVSWKPAISNVGIDRYFVQYSTDFNFIDNVITTDVGNTLSYTFNGLTYNNLYYFRVYAKGNNGYPEFIIPWDPETNSNGVKWSMITRTKCLQLPPSNDLPGLNTYTITYTGLRANYNTYLPNSLYPVGSYSNLNNSLEGLIIKPYSVQVSYSINRSSTPSNHSMTITPYLRIRKCTINGAIEEYFVDTTNSCSGVFELPAYCGINISVYTGANKNKWNGDNDGYNWTLTLNYQYEPPTQINSIIGESKIVNGNPLYQTTVTVEPVAGVASYKYYRRKNNGPVEGLTPSGIKNTSFIDTNLTAHDGFYEYGYSPYDSSSQEWEIKWSNSQTNISPNQNGKVYIPNIPPNPTVIGPQSIINYTDVDFKLPAKDIENEQLEYKLYFRKKGAADWGEPRTVIPTNDNQILKIESLEDKTNYEWYLTCIETDTNIIDRQEVTVFANRSLYVDTHYPLPLCSNDFDKDIYDNMWGTKGQPLSFKVACNPLANFQTFEWDFGDGTLTQSGQQTTHIYTNLSDPTNPYKIIVTATDDQNIQYQGVAYIKIINTPKGKLYADENWTGTHVIEGDIDVPEGITLTIEPNTQVQVRPECSLKISGNLQIKTGTILDSSGLWKGIRFIESGSGTINGMTIRYAVRGISCTGSGEITIGDSLFEQNNTGLHCYKGNISVTGCTFQGSTLYGIKEDNSCNPLVTNCIFQNNGINYYDYQYFKISLLKLNTGSNTGNEYR